MKKKLVAAMCAATMVFAMGTMALAEEEVKATGEEKIALITMDSIDQHWISLNEGAQKAAEEFGVTVDFMSPNTKDDAQQIECVNNAVAGGYDAILVAANGPDAISSALQEAADGGVKIVYVDSPANVEASATFSTDNKAAGQTAGEEMLKVLEEAGVTSGKIGIVNVNAATDSTSREKPASVQHSKEKALSSWRPSTAKAMQRSPRRSLKTTSHRALSASSAVTKVPRPVPVMRSRHPARLISIGGVAFDKSDAIMNLINDGYLLAPWLRTRMLWVTKA